VFAADDERPADVKPEAKTETKPEAKPDTRNVRIIKPFSDLKDLTAEQTERMKEIHKRYNDQIKAIEAQQKQELMAVLTAEQKKELADIETKNRIERKVASAKAKEAKTEAKAPAAGEGQEKK
jgi:hypothetical protein